MDPSINLDPTGQTLTAGILLKQYAGYRNDVIHMALHALDYRVELDM